MRMRILSSPEVLVLSLVKEQGTLNGKRATMLLRARGARSISQAAVYQILHKLVKKGCLKKGMMPARRVRDGIKGRYNFSLTTKGEARHAATWALFQKFSPWVPSVY